MNNLTKEQKEKIFALYLGCDMLHAVDGEMKLAGVTLDGYVLNEEADSSGEGTYDVTDCTLLLSPLSAISDEDAIEVAKIVNMHYQLDSSKINAVKELFSKYWNNTSTRVSPSEMAAIFQYLISKGYAVPLWIAPGHPDNGKTAIELGLAVDKTKTETR